jgi:hypothetical protein
MSSFRTGRRLALAGAWIVSAALHSPAAPAREDFPAGFCATLPGAVDQLIRVSFDPFSDPRPRQALAEKTNNVPYDRPLAYPGPRPDTYLCRELEGELSVYERVDCASFRVPEDGGEGCAPHTACYEDSVKRMVDRLEGEFGKWKRTDAAYGYEIDADDQLIIDGGFFHCCGGGWNYEPPRSRACWKRTDAR